MHAHVGDEIIIAGHEVGQAKRIGRILEVRGSDGGPPYVVRWDDSERSTLLFPGNDSSIKHVVHCGSPEDVAS
jgi:hypothetical protein